MKLKITRHLNQSSNDKRALNQQEYDQATYALLKLLRLSEKSGKEQGYLTSKDIFSM
ncbi:hypothetical protein PN836_008000 [Ningiella sp. W23]|uniref:hypothetical protein n=1 Tax=Ningiella sp. W23 TaxID=3023715 RepID=UPI0037580B88